jgi:hypothetical protein
MSPSNIIVSELRAVRVVDFGHHGSDRIVSGRVGPFSAPERRESPAAPPSEAADIWSVGACLRFALGPRSLPTDVEEVVALATAVDPRDRYESAYAMLGDVRRLLAGRAPKLRSSIAPVPSESRAGVSLSPTSVAALAPSISPGVHPAPSPSAQPPAPYRGEWRGNLVLLLAIALLAGLATFVLVRERMAEETRQHPTGTTQPR